MSSSLKQLIKKEYARCSIDVSHFLREYNIIQHPTRGKIQFNLYEYQKDTIEQFDDHRFIIVNKGRQLGLSTLVAGYILWKMLFTSDYNVLVVATKQTVAKNLVTKIRTMHTNLPTWLKGQTVEDNKLSLRFKNGSQVKAVASSVDAGRSEALSLLVLDEAAHIEQIDDIWTAAQSTLATGGDVIALSTPNGTGNWFHRTWTQAQEGGEFFPINLPWFVHPERDQEWRDQQDKLLGPKAAAQENDCDFITSGHTVIDGPIIEWYRKTHVKEPVEKKGFDGNYWIWTYPDYKRNYMVIADPARGDSTDNAAFIVLDIENLHQVAEYKGKVPPTDFGHMLITVATEWNNALLIIDNKNVGWATVQVAVDRGYSNLFYHYKNDPYLDKSKHLAKSYDLVSKDKMVPGITISTATRPPMINKLETLFRNKIPICRSIRSIEEFFVFIWLRGKAQAMEGYNDDLTMCWAIGMWIRDTALTLRSQGISLDKQLINNIRTVRVSKDSLELNERKKQAQSMWTVPDGKGGRIPIGWLNR